jgi:hypothetical protein
VWDCHGKSQVRRNFGICHDHASGEVDLRIRTNIGK